MIALDRRQLEAAHRAGGTRALRRMGLLGSACALALSPAALGGPTGGEVVGGSAIISGEGSGHTAIDQSSDRAIINWDDFSIDLGESVAFNQPSSSSITLNRVTGGDPSSILGQLTANGRVAIVNPNGVLFGSGARVDVSGLIATTHDIDNARFMAGDLTFDRSSGPDGFVVNEGLISVADAGLAAFVAPHVRNSGVISARLGTVELGAATKFTVDFYGDDLITFPLGSEIQSAPAGAEALVVNDGRIAAEGGSILMTALAARDVIDDVILANGEVAASSFSRKGGTIVLSGGEAGGVRIGGALDASGTTGGSVVIEGESVYADGLVSARGGQGAGGSVSVAADWLSVGGTLDAGGASGGGVEIAADGLSLAGAIAAAGASGAGGTVDIDVAVGSFELASARIDASGATSGGSIRNTAGAQITSSAHYDASGGSGAGGEVDISAPATKLLSASIDASGASGGRVRVGGEFQGGKGLAEDELANAALVGVTQGARIDVSGRAAGGAGGEAVIWSDVETTFLGAIDARPGAGGRGGLIEVSSRERLDFAGDLQTGGGHVLLDPKNIVIVEDVAPSQLAVILGYNAGDVPGLDEELAAFGRFGNSVALDGNRLVVGAPYRTTTGGSESGAVYMFTFSDALFSDPVLEGIIGAGFTGGKNIDFQLADFNNLFGLSLALDGTRLAVGAPREGEFRGAVYLFEFADEVFTSPAANPLDPTDIYPALQAVIGVSAPPPTGPWLSYAPTVPAGTDVGLLGFGSGVALDGGRLAIGAASHSGQAGSQAGGVYLYTFTEGTPFSNLTQRGVIGSGPMFDINVPGLRGDHDIGGVFHEGDRFGYSLSLEGTRLVVGAPFDDGFGDTALDSGAVYLFTFSDLAFNGGALAGRIGLGYEHDASLFGAGTGDRFGEGVSLDGSLLAVGAPLGDGADDPQPDWDSGEVYLLSITGAGFPGFTRVSTIGDGFTGPGDIDLGMLQHFDSMGRGVSLDGGRLAIGAPGDDPVGPVGLPISDLGAVYLVIAGGATLPTGQTFGNNPGGLSFITSSSIEALLNSGNTVTLQANNDIAVNAEITAAGMGVLELQAGRSILINQDISVGSFSATANMLLPGGGGAIPSEREAGPAEIRMASGTSITTTGTISLLTEYFGQGETGDITLASLTGSGISVDNRGLTAGSDVVILSGGVLTATGLDSDAQWGHAILIEAAGGTFTNLAGAGAFAFTNALPGHYAIWADHPDLATEGVTGYVKRYNLPTALSWDSFVLSSQASGQNVIGYRVAPVIDVAAIANGKVYGEADPTLGFSVNGLIDGDAQGLMLTGGVSRASGQNAGVYAINQGSLALTTAALNLGYTLDYTGANFEITPRPITVTADDLSKVYGNVDPELTYAITSGSLVGTDTLTGGLVRASGQNVGTYAINQGSLTGGGNYALTFVGAELSITPRPITVTADDLSKVYGNADPALTYAITSGNLVGTDTLTGGLIRVSGQNVGTYAINQGSLTAGGNYDLTFVGGELSITPRPVTVNAVAAQKTYGDADPDFDYTVAASTPLLAGDTLTGALGRAPGENVAGQPYAFNLGTLGNPNYVITLQGGGLTITPATLVITPQNATRQYGDANPGFAADITGFKLSDDASLVSGLSLGTTATTVSNVGAYQITASGASAGPNYVIAYQTGTLTVTPRPITVTAISTGKKYGEADPALTYAVTVGNLVNGDVLAGALVRDPGEDVGSYEIRQGTLAASSNYALTYVGADFVITKANLIVVTPNDATRFYGDANPMFTATFSGFAPGDDESVISGLTFTTTATQTSAAGSYDIVASGATAQNYTISYSGPGTLTVLPRPITVTADMLGKTYGDADPALTYAITSGNLVFGDTLTGDLVRVAGENVGTYAINQGGLTAGSNYAISFVPGALSITPATLVITANDATRVYGDANPTFTASFSGFKLGDDAGDLTGLVFTTAATQSSGVGTYDIIASGAASPNYVISYGAPGALTITPAPLVVRANDAVRLLGEPNPPLTATISGLKLGDDASVLSGLTLATTAGPGSPPGFYAITSSGGTAANYMIVERVDGVLAVVSTDIVAEIMGDLYRGQAFPVLGGLAGGDAAALTFVNAGSSDAVGLFCALAERRDCPTTDGASE